MPQVAERPKPFLFPEFCKGCGRATTPSAIGAILAGCRHFFGYPITPSTEGPS
jgi:hypothetical protein